MQLYVETIQEEMDSYFKNHELDWQGNGKKYILLYVNKHKKGEDYEINVAFGDSEDKAERKLPESAWIFDVYGVGDNKIREYRK